MSAAPERQPSPELERTAAQWVVRCDRGLTAAEQDEYSQWLAAAPQHREALAAQRWSWDELDRLAGSQLSLRARPDPDLLAPGRRARSGVRLAWVGSLALAAAALVAADLYLVPSWRGRAPAPPVAATALASLTAPCERRTLEDGSVVELNRDAAIEVDYAPAARRVRLLRGEANFTVAKNPARPFIVEASGVEVQAVGTIFNVRLDSASVDVLVSEGTVKLKRPTEAPAEPRFVRAGEQAVVLLAQGARPAQVASLTPEAIAVRLAWQPRMLEFDNTPLPEIVAAFNAHNPVHLTLGDPALERVRLSANFRSDNVAGFVRLMKHDFGMYAERITDSEIVLRRDK
jgi:transmembrane sensor